MRKLRLVLVITVSLGLLAIGASVALGEIIHARSNASGILIVGRGSEGPTTLMGGQCPAEGVMQVDAFIHGTALSTIDVRAVCVFQGQEVTLPAACFAQVPAGPPPRGADECTGFGGKAQGRLHCTVTVVSTGSAGWHARCFMRDP
jgi:hypothetical protein